MLTDSKHNIEFVEANAPYMDELMAPLKKYGIEFFVVVRGYDDGSYYYLTNDPNTYRFTILNELPVITTIEDELYEALKTKSKIKYSVPMSGVYKDLLDHMKIFYPYGIYYRYPGYVDCYCFAGSKNSSWLPNFYSNENEHLEAFISIFKNEAKSILSQATITKGLLSKNMHSNLTGLNEHQPFPKRRRFLLSPDDLNRYITKRELDCISQLAEGKTVKEAATSLSLSDRTVENYLNNAKTRLSCINNRALLKAYTESELILKFPEQ